MGQADWTGQRLVARLSEEERLALEHVVMKSPDWRVPSSQPLLSREVAKVNSSGLVVQMHYCCTSAPEFFRGFVVDQAQRVSNPVVVLGNVSCYGASAICLALLTQRGVTYKFQPAFYRPELNRIEMMGRRMKLHWLAVKPRVQLERVVEHVFKHFGREFQDGFRAR